MQPPSWPTPPAPPRRGIPVLPILIVILFAIVVGPRIYAMLPMEGAVSALASPDAEEGEGNERGVGNELPARLTSFDDTIFRPLRIPDTDPFGYPANTTDRPRIAGLLLRGDYDGLERLLNRLQAQVLADVRYEYHLVDAFHALGRTDAEAGARMDAWVARYPRSAHARLGRARHHASRAWDTRGTDWISETPPEQVAGMRTAAVRAAEDARAALALDPTHLVGYTLLLELVRMAGTDEEQKAVLDAALRQHPDSYLVHDEYMAGLEPRWGGSLREMRRFGREAAARKGRNPRLAALEGAAHAYEAQQHRRARRYPESIRAYDRAIEFGPESDYLRGRGRTWLGAEDYVRAHADLEAALQQRPHGPEALELHGRALYGFARALPPAIMGTAIARAEADFRLLAAVEPGNPEAARWLKAVDELKAWCRALPEPCR